MTGETSEGEPQIVASTPRLEAEAGKTVVRFGRGLKPGRYAVTLAAEGRRARMVFRVR